MERCHVWTAPGNFQIEHGWHLQDALAHVVENHPMLRASFTHHGQEWRQEIQQAPADFQVTLVNLSNLDPAAQQEAMIEAANAHHAGIDLAGGFPLQALLFDWNSRDAR